MPQQDASSLYVVMISVHGLIRGHDLESGRDADTGGQTRYVVELSRAPTRLPGVEGVDLFTRLVDAIEHFDFFRACDVPVYSEGA